MTKAKKKGMIRYVGGSHRRGLTVEDFRAVFVEDQDKDVWWTAENNWAVPRSDLTDEAYEAAIRRDPEFILVGGDPAEGSRSEARDPAASQMTPMPIPEQRVDEPPPAAYPSGATREAERDGMDGGSGTT